KADLADPSKTAALVDDYFGFKPKDEDATPFFQFFANQGDGLTPLHYEFIPKFAPVPPAYTKPIVMLIDGMALSAADFVPATLKDNKRVKLFGTTTAGAGGDQRVVGTRDVCRADGQVALVSLCAPFEVLTALETLGFRGYALTVTMGERDNGQPIENIGAE